MNKNIVITSNEGWGDTWYSKQNYAYELSQHNRVFFIDSQEKWTFKNILTPQIETFNYTKNLTVVKYKNPLPILNKVLYKANERIVSRRIRKYFERNNVNELIYWAFDPFRLSDPKMLNAKLSIFHSVDLYRFNNYAEENLARKSDYVFYISPQMAREYEKYNKNLFLVPHGISKEEFTVDDDLEFSNSIKMSDYGLYVGAVDDRINMKLLERILIKFPDTKFLFIGRKKLPENDEAAERIFVNNMYPNLQYHPAIHFKKLKYYIAKAKFCLCIMDYTKEENRVSHHKMLQYLALGKPVFGSLFDEYDETEGLTYMSNDDDRVLKNLELFIKNGEDEQVSEKRIEYARGFTFEMIFKKVENIIDNKSL